MVDPREKVESREDIVDKNVLIELQSLGSRASVAREPMRVLEGEFRARMATDGFYRNEPLYALGQNRKKQKTYFYFAIICT